MMSPRAQPRRNPAQWFAERYNTWDVAWPMRCVVCGQPPTEKVTVLVQTSDPEWYRPGPFSFYVCAAHEDTDPNEVVQRSGIKVWPTDG
jgi:hypothetical protein